MDGLCPNQFQWVQMNNLPAVGYLLTTNVLLYDIDIVDGDIIGQLATRSVKKYEKTARLRYNNPVCYVSNKNAVFQEFCCLNCDNFSQRTFKLERNLTTCRNELKMSIPGTYMKSEKLSLLSWTLLILSKRISKTLQRFCKIQLWITFCPRKDLQRNKDNKLDRKTSPNISIRFFNPWGRAIFRLELSFSSLRCILFWLFRISGSTEKNSIEIFKFRHRDKKTD